MAYDGLTVAATCAELNSIFQGASITKIAQPEKNELLLTLKANRVNRKLYLSADPSLPVVYVRDDSTLSPVNAPAFCMALRKHIGGGRIRRVFQPGASPEKAGLERILIFEIEHLDEMGDLGVKYLIAELMGKHSNLILTDPEYTVIDSIRHISAMQSSVREVLPGKCWFIPDTRKKHDPYELKEDRAAFLSLMQEGGMAADKRLYSSITGLSPVLAAELCFRAGLDADKGSADLSEEELLRLYDAFSELMETVRTGAFRPELILRDGEAEEYCAVPLTSLSGGAYEARPYDSMMDLVRDFYDARALKNRMHAKSEDLRHLVRNLTERTAKKLDLQEKDLRATEKADVYRVRGELINTYGYGLPEGAKELRCENYYDENREIVIPLDPDLSPRENAKKNFDRYMKLKRTREALIPQTEESRQKLWHLESIRNALELAGTEADLNEIRREMREYGFLKKQPEGRKLRKEEQRSEPLHFVSSDGIDLYVGKNNYQNEYITFKLAEGDDWWFHIKNRPGSHVIAKTGGRELPDRTCLEAAALAAYYSSAQSAGGAESRQKAEVDYVQRKALKRVPGAAPGYVIYHTNYSMMIEPSAGVCYNR